jgi:hypothetical protein
MQVLMAAGAAADAIEEPAAEDSTRVLMAGWELFSGASADQDDARVGLLAALAGRLNDAIMLMVARWRRGEGDEAALAARDAGPGARWRTRDAAARGRRGVRWQ